MQVNEKAKPFIKWAGGKGQLLGQLDKYLPQRLYNEDFTYVEPFAGGGAMLFHILKNFPHLKAAIINDVNEDLVKAYKTIKDNPLKLIDGLHLYKRDWPAEGFPRQKHQESRGLCIWCRDRP